MRLTSVYMLFIVAMKCLSLLSLFVRETQNLASLQADTIVVIYGKLHDGMRSKLK